MKYNFKKSEELGWAVAVAVGIFVLDILIQFDPAVVTDWRAWAVAILGGTVRAGAAGALAYIQATKKKPPQARKTLLD